MIYSTVVFAANESVSVLVNYVYPASGSYPVTIITNGGGKADVKSINLVI